MSMTILAEVNGIETEINIHNPHSDDAHFWLVLPFGARVPLARVNTAEGVSYCYFSIGEGTEYQETRVYSDGIVVTR